MMIYTVNEEKQQTVFCHLLYEGHSINKLQNSVILLIFKT